MEEELAGPLRRARTAHARRHATELEVVIQAMRASTEETDGDYAPRSGTRSSSSPRSSAS